MSRFGDCVSLLTDSLSTVSLEYFHGACDAMEVFHSYEEILTILEYIRDEKGTFPTASRKALLNKIAYYAQFQIADNE